MNQIFSTIRFLQQQLQQLNADNTTAVETTIKSRVTAAETEDIQFLQQVYSNKVGQPILFIDSLKA
jgi:hypothetical protein